MKNVVGRPQPEVATGSTVCVAQFGKVQRYLSTHERARLSVSVQSRTIIAGAQRQLPPPAAAAPPGAT